MSWMKLAQMDKRPIFILLLRKLLSINIIMEKRISGSRNNNIPPMPAMMQIIGPLTQPGFGALHKAIKPNMVKARNRKAISRQAKVPNVKIMGSRCTSFSVPG
jgi:hypothetical protein